MASNSCKLCRFEGATRIPMNIKREEIDEARKSALDSLVPVAELADELPMDRCVMVRHFKRLGIEVLKVLDYGDGGTRWKLAVSKSDAVRLVAELKKQGYGAGNRRRFLGRDQIAELVKGAK